MRDFKTLLPSLLAAFALTLTACGTSAPEFGDDAGMDGGIDAPGSDSSSDTPGSDAPVSDAGADAPSPEWTPCAIPSECTLAANTCCGVCGQPELENFDGIHVDDRDAHYASVCDDPDPICPGCATMPNPWLLAECAEQSCEATDLRQDPITECSADEECVLRVTGCCACGGNTNPEALIAIATEAVGTYIERVCDPGQACLGCEPAYPEFVEAACSEAGRCIMRFLDD